MQLGSIYEGKMDRSIDAVESYRKALEINPRNFSAMDALERIHSGEEQWEDCIEVMGRRVAALEDAMASAAKKQHRIKAPVRATMNRETGAFEAFIVKQVVDAHGGRVEAEQPVGKPRPPP